MASEMTQRQRAEVVAEQICDAVNTMAYPSGTITRLVRNALQEARQEALREASDLIKLMPMLTAHNVAAILDRLAREGRGRYETDL